jgi:hypothetical protein
MGRDLGKVQGEWEGTGELWLDPLGNEAKRSECAMKVEANAVRYTWQYEGETKEGVITLGDASATWTDTWHQPKPVEGAYVKDAWGLFTFHYTYDPGEGPPWGWRTKLSERPTGELVLQMTNITPWGEEGRAVRMTFKRRGG